MSEKRRDKKGRILKTGESQRPDGRYQYRYKDGFNKYKYIYSYDLQALREEEKQIEQDLKDGIDYAAGNITVSELARRYISQKQGARHNTQVGYNFVLNILDKEEFGHKIIRNVKLSDAKAWCIKLHEENDYKFSTINAVKGILRPAFKMAVDDDIIRKSPFEFALTSIIAKDTSHRKALTKAEQESFLAYIKSDKCRSRYYDVFLILLHTGMRISELCGLTVNDIDFEKEEVRIERQLMRRRDSEYYIEKPKTNCGNRYIPFMNEEVRDAFKRVVESRIKLDIEPMVDGVSGFLFIDINGKPKTAMHFEHSFKRIVDNYNASHPSQIAITPHVLRHTFCTEMSNVREISTKSLQYLMGHADVSTTLGIYAHEDYDAMKKSVAEYKASKTAC